MLFMLIYYRLPGLLADLALTLYALFLFAVIKLLGIPLSLPAIAATVLTIGMAVDANVLIFERMKEEMRAGRTMSAAIDLGFKRAWPSIRDSNASTLITCVILYWFGNNFGATLIVGFATSLAIGVLISLFTAWTVTRTFLNVLLLRGIALHPALYGLPTNALNIGRYNRPSSRLSSRTARPPAVVVASSASDAQAAKDEELEGEEDSPLEDTDGDSSVVGSNATNDQMEPVGNVRNGRAPSQRRRSSTGNTSGSVED
jgi:uncharacterized membrane protein YdfJ with MMPL/SSD domain